MGEFIEASINFTNDDIFLMYGVMTVVFFAIAFVMYKSSLNDD